MSDSDPASRDSALPGPRPRFPERVSVRGVAQDAAARSRGGRLPALRPPPGLSSADGPRHFDAEQARQAWRQFARARGAVRRDTEPSSRRWGPWLFLALGVGVAAMIYQARAEPNAMHAAGETKASRPGGKASPTGSPATGNEGADAADAAGLGRAPGPMLGRAPLATPQLTAPQPAEQDVAPLDAAGSRPSVLPPVVAPSPYVPRVREPPEGTPPELAVALTKIPRARNDRAPIGGVGVHGIHVDRIKVGPRREDGSCGDARRRLSQAGDSAVQVCFRVVHQRQAQRLLVHWIHGGELVRRTFLSVPADRAYRTRAWMPLGARGNPRGAWTAIVKTDEGVELAREEFDVGP